MDTDMQKIRSDKDVHEWYPLCPCQVRKNTVYETDGRVYLSVTTAILTAGHVTALHVTIRRAQAAPSRHPHVHRPGTVRRKNRTDPTAGYRHVRTHHH